MVAIEARYHGSCLCSLYRTIKQAERYNLPENSNNLVYGIVFSEVINHMKKAIESNIEPVFKLTELKKLFCTSYKRYQGYQGYTGFIIELQSTRFKEELVRHLPGLQANTNDSNCVILKTTDVVIESINAALSPDHVDSEKCFLKQRKFHQGQLFGNTYHR